MNRPPHSSGRSAPGSLIAALLLTAAAPLTSVASVRGQERPTGADSAAGDTVPVFHEDPVVVRVLRSPAASRMLPFAVTVRDLSRVAPGAGLSLDDALRSVPGLQIDNRHTDALGDRIVLRGFGARSQFGVRGIQILVDGIPATMPDGQTTLNHVDPALLTRAEVLRGPAAAAYGNAAGGVILLSTISSSAAGDGPEMALTRGSNGLFRGRATLAGSTGGGGWLGSGSVQRTEGFRPHSAADRYHVAGRFDTPAAGGHLRFVLHGVSYDAENPGALTWEQFGMDPHQAQAFNVAQATGEEGHHGQLGLSWERPVGPAVLEAAGYGLSRGIANPIPPAIIDLDRLAGGGRLLLRSAGVRSGEPYWGIGVDAAGQGDQRRNFENDGGRRGALTLDQEESVSNVALHGHAMIPALDRLGLFLGVRYDQVRFAATDRLVGPEDPDDSGSRTMDALSPTAGVRLDVVPGVQLFGNVSTAFETPTTTELVNRPGGAGGFNEALEPQRTVSYEVGGRAALGAALDVQANLYHARVRDALVPFEVESAPGRQFFRNAASAVHEGLELVAELGTRRVDVLAVYSRTVAHFDTYATAERSYDGLAVPGVRPWTTAVTVSGRPARDLTLALDYRVTGAMPVDDANEFTAPGHTLLGLRLAAPPFRLAGIEVAAHGGFENLLDEPYVASVVPNAFGGRFFEPGPGRTVYVGIETRFAGGR